MPTTIHNLILLVDYGLIEEEAEKQASLFVEVMAAKIPKGKPYRCAALTQPKGKEIAWPENKEI